MKQLPNLYILRFFLALCVIIYHLPLICKGLQLPYFSALPLFHKGTLSVYYFFTLSGFLIFRTIYNELSKTNDFNFKSFYIRRIQRLYPVYYTVLIVGILIYHVILPKIGIVYDEKYALKDLLVNYVFLVPNVFMFYHPGVGSILIVLWSIGIEEQFYLIAPLFLYLFRKKLLASICVLLVILILVLLLYPLFYKYSNYYFYFVSGGLFALLAPINFFKKKMIHLMVYLLFILSFFTNWFEFSSTFAYHIFNLLISGLLISLISDYHIFEIKNKFFDYVGKISYGLYMYHMIVITAVLFLVNKFKIQNYLNPIFFVLILNIVVVMISIWVAHLSYKYFESRFYRTAKRNNLVVK